jgi:peptidoglycan/xylan/chitin deacetylase (PgdA/CDA1 family)
VLAGLALVIGIVIGAGGSAAPHPQARAAPPGFFTRLRTLAGSGAGSFAVAEQRAENGAIDRTLSYTPWVRIAGSQHKEIALTFDDGPGPFTPEVLRVLRRLHVPATFFLVGRSIKDFGAYVPSELADGLAIGNHTQDHSPMAALSRADQVTQLLDQARDVAAYGVPFPHLFRPPYGSFNTTTLEITKKLKMLTILWTIDTADFRQPGTDVIVKSVISGAKPGAIVLMHDAGGPRTQTVAALPRIVTGLRRRGYALVTVPRLLADDPPLQSQEAPPPGLSGG